MKILHIIPAEKFTPTFINFIRQNFDDGSHSFFTFGDLSQFPYDIKNDSIHIKSQYHPSLKAMKAIHDADEIILHGMLVCRIINLFFQPWAYKKCHWLLWGGELYNDLEERKSLAGHIKLFLNKLTNPDLKSVITYLQGDYSRACTLFHKKFKFYESIMYHSNVYKALDIPEKKGSHIDILLGNSGDPYNEHEDALNILRPFKDEDIRIHCTLSYMGPPEYVKKIVKLGHDMFGNKFRPILDFWPYEKYLEFLGEIDVAIFTHKRQQAMGNTISLLGLGKKVFIQDNTSQFEFFEQKGIKVYPAKDFHLTPLETEVKNRNIAIIKQYFSEENLKKQWADIFKDFK